MAYLECAAVVHRDLAARNCLVKDFLGGAPLVKVSDFGLSRALPSQTGYYKATSSLIPVKVRP